MLSQKSEAQGWRGWKSAAEVGRVKKKKRKENYFTALARIFVGQQHGHAADKMCEEEK